MRVKPTQIGSRLGIKQVRKVTNKCQLFQPFKRLTSLTNHTIKPTTHYTTLTQTQLTSANPTRPLRFNSGIKMATKHQDCQCYFNSLGYDNEPDFYKLSPDMVKQAFQRGSLACHPDKNPSNLKHLATRAQQILNQAREVISDVNKCFEYLDSGSPPEVHDHDCSELKPVIEFIRQHTQPDKPANSTSPPPQSTPEKSSSSTSYSRFNIFDFDEPASPCTSADEESTTPDNSEAKKKKRGRRRSVFEPSGYQLQGGKVTFNKHRTQGSVYKFEWAAKPGYSTWLSEEDLVKFYPKEAREYLEMLKREKSKRLSGIIKKAGPITEFL